MKHWLVAAGLLVGCEIEPVERMTEKVALFYREVSLLEDASQAHYLAQQSLIAEIPQDLLAIEAEELAHQTDSTAYRDQMIEVVEVMGECRRNGAGPHTQDIASLLTALSDEIASHSTNMDQVADLSAEESRHQARVVALLQGMRDHQAELEDEAYFFACPVDAATE